MWEYAFTCTAIICNTLLCGVWDHIDFLCFPTPHRTEVQCELYLWLDWAKTLCSLIRKLKRISETDHKKNLRYNLTLKRIFTSRLFLSSVIKILLSTAAKMIRTSRNTDRIYKMAALRLCYIHSYIDGLLISTCEMLGVDKKSQIIWSDM